jgi:hypothetical protein
MIENKSPIRNISSPFEFFLSNNLAIQIIYVFETEMARYSHSLSKVSYFLPSTVGHHTDTAKLLYLPGLSISFVSILIFDVACSAPLLGAIPNTSVNCL